MAWRNTPATDCAEYAHAVRNGMAERGVESNLVTYTVSCNDPLPQVRRHQVVMYFVGHECWMMDNAGRKPVWVGMDTDPLTQRLEQFHAGAWVHIAFVVVE